MRYYSNFTFSRKKKIHFQIWPLLFNWYKTQSQLVWSFEFQSMVKVKVVKWCRKKWNGHNLMYISITNNVKSYKKFTETAQMSNFSDFPLILCRNGPKGTRTMQTQTHFAQIGKKNFQGMPSKSWRPGLSENVVVFVAKFSCGWLKLRQI